MFFEKTNPKEKTILLLDQADVGAAILDSKVMAANAGFSERDQVLIATVVSELSTNIIRYAEHGEITIRKIRILGRDGLEIIASDKGPGIKDVAKALEDHFTTTPSSLGMGLSSVKRIMDEFSIESEISKGTRITARKWKSEAINNRVDYFCSLRPLLGAEDECGDLGIIEINENECFLGLIDAVGHGSVAYDIAVTARDYLQANCHKNLVQLLNELHEQLRQTRGAVATICRLNLSTGEAVFSGIGNICTRIMGPRNLRIVPGEGIIGYMMSTPKEQRIRLHSGDILVMTSDGVEEHFDPKGCIDLFTGSAEHISKELIRRFGKENDDAGCLTMRLLL